MKVNISEFFGLACTVICIGCLISFFLGSILAFLFTGDIIFGLLWAGWSFVIGIVSLFVVLATD